MWGMGGTWGQKCAPPPVAHPFISPCSSLFLDVIVLHDSHPRRVRAVQPGLPPASHNVPHDRAVKAREILLLPLVYRRGHRASGSLRIPLQVTQLGSSRPVLPSSSFQDKWQECLTLASISCSCCQRHSKRLSNPALECPSRWQPPRMSMGASPEGYKLFPWVPICNVPTRGVPESFFTWSM